MQLTAGRFDALSENGPLGKHKMIGGRARIIYLCFHGEYRGYFLIRVGPAWRGKTRYRSLAGGGFTVLPLTLLVGDTQ